MAIITEDYVSFEIAKLLKEKGFMEGAIIKFFASGYDSKGNILDIRDTELKDYPRPTLQMAMKWLREEKGIAAVPILRSVLDNEKFLWDIEITVAKTNETYHQGWTYESYERACEAAIKYSLRNLI
jgi:hypothetical protein